MRRNHAELTSAPNPEELPIVVSSIEPYRDTISLLPLELALDFYELLTELVRLKSISAIRKLLKEHDGLEAGGYFQDQPLHIYAKLEEDNKVAIADVFFLHR